MLGNWSGVDDIESYATSMRAYLGGLGPVDLAIVENVGGLAALVRGAREHKLRQRHNVKLVVVVLFIGVTVK